MPVLTAETSTRRRSLYALLWAVPVGLLVIAAAGIGGLAAWLYTTTEPVPLGPYAIVGPRCTPSVWSWASNTRYRGVVTSLSIIRGPSGKAVFVPGARSGPRRIGQFLVFGP